MNKIFNFYVAKENKEKEIKRSKIFSKKAIKRFDWFNWCANNDIMKYSLA